ncbi:MAG TPA: hypothetical protein PKE30_00350 [Niabella sp.]|nr:hypothetical protein [Niabella sp.]
MSEHNFPRGFESWQKTHFEVVEALCYLRDLEEEKQVKNFSQMIDHGATEDLYKLAIQLTDKFETENVDRSGSTLFDLVEAFVCKETKH